jgi:hypothetical protein
MGLLSGPINCILMDFRNNKLNGFHQTKYTLWSKTNAVGMEYYGLQSLYLTYLQIPVYDDECDINEGSNDEG